MPPRIAFFSLFLLATVASPSSALTLQPIYEFGGEAPHSWRLVEDHLYVTDATSLTVYSLGTSSREVSRTLGGYRGMLSAGNYLWVSRDLSGYDVFDVTNSASPSRLGSLSHLPTGIGVFDDATNLYLEFRENGDAFDVDLLDLTDPLAPVSRGLSPAAIVIPPDDPDPDPSYIVNVFIHDVQIDQGILYALYSEIVTDTSSGDSSADVYLRTWDARFGAPFPVIQTHRLSVIPILLSGNDAGQFLARDGWLYTVNVDACCQEDVVRRFTSGIGGLQLQDEYPTGGSQDYVHAVKALAFDADALTLKIWGREYTGFDVEGSAPLTKLCELPIATGLAPEGAGDLVASLQSIGEMDVVRPSCTGLEFLARAPHYVPATRILDTGEVVVFLGSAATAVDFSTPEAPMSVGQLSSLTGSPSVAAALGPRSVVLGAGDTALEIVDFSVPGAPTSTLATIPGVAQPHLAAMGSLVGYVRDGPATKTSLQLMDLSVPGAPAEVGIYSRASAQWPLSQTGDIAMTAGAAYLSVGDEIWVMDLSDPTSPTRVLTFVASGVSASPQIELSVVGSFLVSSDVDDHRLWSLADPLSPTFVGQLALGPDPARIEDVALVGGRLAFWLASDLYVVDPAAPATPEMLHVAPPGTNLRSLASTGTDLVLREGSRIEVMRLTNPTPVDLPPAGSPAIRLRTFPNPTSGSVHISAELPTSAPAELTVYDLEGRFVRRWSVNGATPMQLDWDGRDQRGRLVASGTYLLNLRWLNGQASGRVVLMR